MEVFQWIRGGFVLLLVAVQAGALASCPDGDRPGLLNIQPAGGWGIDHGNQRLQRQTSLTRNNIDQLALKWVYRFSSMQPRTWPLVSEDTIWVADAGRGVVALDRETGCVRWERALDSQVASALTWERAGDTVRLFVTERQRGVLALDASTGAVLWRSSPGDNPVPMYSGSPLAVDGTLYVPLSSMEIALSANPFYGCCTTSGGLAALDTATGATRWYARSIPDLPQVTGRHWLFVEEWGPSGAPVWGAPMYDATRDLVWFGTGQNYSRPASLTSDAVIALEAATGAPRHVLQFTAGDAYNLACNTWPGHPNCPEPVGPDVDFGAPPVLTTLPGGRELVIGGQKSGDVHAIDPDTGATLWSQRVGRGGALGGVHWGLAVNPDLGLVFVPIHDINAGPLTGPGEASPGMHALDLATGEPRWSYVRTRECDTRQCAPGLSAAPIATPDLVVTGSFDGMLEALDARTGERLWHYDSVRDYETVSGEQASGGTFDAHGPLVVDDLVIVASGYASFGAKGGNALLVFQAGKEPGP